MAMRRRSFPRRRRRRQNVYWDRIAHAQTGLPNVLLDNTTSIQGAMTSIRRYADSADVVIKRWLWRHLVRLVLAGGGSIGLNSAVEICVGLTIMDSMSDVDGQATNRVIASGTGPLSDADNSRWVIRCCVLVPLGQIANELTNAVENVNIPMSSAGGYSSGNLWLIPTGTAGAAEMSWWCEVDTRSARKLEGLETEWITVALEASMVGAALPAGATLDVLMNAQELRNVIALKR